MGAVDVADPAAAGSSCRPGAAQRRLGVVVNPIAGMGGAVGLRGTDGEAGDRARALGAAPSASLRAARALRRVSRSLPRLDVLAAAGGMGADLALSCGWQPEVLARSRSGPTSAADTVEAAGQLLARGVDLLLFAGGDGTARDVLSATGTRLPLLGVPTGVKMHSGVFATSPEAAADVAVRFLSAAAPAVREAEVLDADEDARREDRLSTRLHGVALVPLAVDRLQRTKAAPVRQDEAALEAACRAVAAELAPGRLYLLGPGTTTRRILRALGLDGSLTGIDAVRDGRLVGRDLAERDLLALLAERPPTTVVLGVVGGQGFLLGRGNQQLSSAVLERVEDLLVVASAEKLAALDPAVLRVDLGHEHPSALFTGYRRVRTGPATSTVLQVVS